MTNRPFPFIPQTAAKIIPLFYPDLLHSFNTSKPFIIIKKKHHSTGNNVWPAVVAYTPYNGQQSAKSPLAIVYPEAKK